MVGLQQFMFQFNCRHLPNEKRQISGIFRSVPRTISSLYKSFSNPLFDNLEPVVTVHLQYIRYIMKRQPAFRIAAGCFVGLSSQNLKRI